MKSSAILFLALIIAGPVSAQFTSPSEKYTKVSDALAERIYRPQERIATCWAACNSMLLAAEGIDSDEEDQIRRMSKFSPTAGLNGAGAHFFLASKALAGTYEKRQVKVFFQDRRLGLDPSMNGRFVSLIQKGQPVMVATPQHGMVAVGVKSFPHPAGHTAIVGIEVLDPSPNGGRRWLSAQELGAVFGYMAIERGAKEIASDEERKPKDKPKAKLSGTWQGRLAQLGLTLVVRIQGNDDGYTAKTNCPEQGPRNFDTEVTLTGTKVELDIATPNPASFSGTLNGDSVEGIFSQSGLRIPLRLRKQ